MKIRITLKDPDGVSNSVDEAAKQNVYEGDNEQELENVKERIETIISDWIRWGEYVTIEIDVDTGIARVLKVNEG